MMMPPFVELHGQVAVTLMVGSLTKSSPSRERPTGKEVVACPALPATGPALTRVSDDVLACVAPGAPNASMVTAPKAGISLHAIFAAFILLSKLLSSFARSAWPQTQPLCLLPVILSRNYQIKTHALNPID
jgi:hypothetical protein